MTTIQENSYQMGLPLIELNQNVNVPQYWNKEKQQYPLIELNQNVNLIQKVKVVEEIPAFNRTKLECKYR